MTLLVVSPPQASARRPHVCFPPESKTVAHTQRARVFTGRDGGFYGCSFDTARLVYLGDENGSAANEEYVWVLQLRGWFVAASHYLCEGTGIFRPQPDQPRCHSFFRIYDVRRAKSTVRLSFSRGGGVGEAVLKYNGSAAWVEGIPTSFNQFGDPVTKTTQYVLRARTTDGDVQLDSGVGQAGPRRLALKGNTLSWTSAGQRKSAELN
jgi:hypothetical protein